jgi:hypothetical protein
LTSRSAQRPDIAAALVIAALFTAAGYTSFGCGPSSAVRVPLPASHPRSPGNAATLTVVLRDFSTGEPIEGGHVTVTQSKFGWALATGIGGSAYFYDGLAEGPVRIDISAPGYEKASTASALVAGYNKEELRLKRREQ